MRSVHHARFVVEPLERRQLLAAVNLNLGALQGRAFEQGSVDGPTQDTYHLTLNQAGRIDVQVSRLLFGKAKIIIQQDGGGSVATGFSSQDQRLTFDAFDAGTFAVKVDAPSSQQGDRTFYTLEITTDFAAGALVSGSSVNIAADTGRNFGQLLVGNTTFRDFIGFFDTTNHAAKDVFDTTFFDLPARGFLDLTLDQLTSDTADIFAEIKATARIFRDSNGDGQLDGSEVIDTVSATPGQSGSIIPHAYDPGHYAVVVSPKLSTNVSAGGSNYRLQLDYSVFDNAFNTLKQANLVGALGATPKTFTDFISSQDTIDIYQITTPAGGPFLFDAKLSGFSGADLDLDLTRDINNNGQIDISNGEILTFSQNRGAFEEHIARLLDPNLTFFLRVKRFFGQSNYTLTMSSTNQDHFGNTLATAPNIGELVGRRRITELVSATDTDDIIKFNTSTSGTIAASFPATTAGTNADLQLVQDLNNDKEIQANEVLAVGGNAGSAGESISRVSAAGTYFIVIHRVTGTPAYDLTFSLDTAGSATDKARTLGAGGTIEFVGRADATDIFKIAIAAPVQFNVFISLLEAPVQLSIAVDTNNNGKIDTGETAFSTIVTDFSGRFPLTIKTGTRIFVTIASSNGSEANYGIVPATAPIDAGGNTLADAGLAVTADAFGISASTFHDFVGEGSVDPLDDFTDFYRARFLSGGPFEFTANLTQLTGDANLQLLFDANNNHVVDSGEVLLTQSHTGTTPEQFTFTVVNPGNYYVKVFRVSGQVNYTLALAVTSADRAGNSLERAKDLGNLTGTLTAADLLSRIDSTDIFRFTVASAGELSVHLSATPAGALPLMEIIRDINGDNEVGSGEIIASAFFTGDTLNGVVLPVAGSYFIAFETDGVDVNYSALLTFSPQTPFHGTPFIISGTGNGTKIEMEDFDRGGPGVAYLDATASNNDGSARNTDQVDVKVANEGGFRVTDTAVGEFLEYTIAVDVSGNYDFEFRVASPDPGGSSHVEIDGVNVTGTVNVPNTGNVQTFTTVTKPNIFLVAGPHIMRLAFDSITGGTSQFAGTYNFIRIKPTPVSTGTFALQPPTSTAKVGEATTLTLQWTVPSGSWHLLKAVQLRLIDDDGTVLWLKFDEASGTFSLFNENSGKFGPAKSPGKGKLSSKFASVDLSASAIQGAGPLASSVALSFRITFKKHAGGRTFRVEAAASDDLGHDQPFMPAGTIVVGG